jgi:hypothetical protein
MSEITLAIHHDHLGVDVLWPVLELKVGRPVCMNGGRTGRIGERVSFDLPSSDRTSPKFGFTF